MVFIGGRRRSWQPLEDCALPAAPAMGSSDHRGPVAICSPPSAGLCFVFPSGICFPSWAESFLPCSRGVTEAQKKRVASPRPVSSEVLPGLPPRLPASTLGLFRTLRPLQSAWSLRRAWWAHKVRMILRPLGGWSGVRWMDRADLSQK